MEFYFITMALLATVSASVIPRRENEQDIISDLIGGTTNFSASILLRSRLTSSGSVSNCIFSPLGLINNLAMLRSCSNGEARQEYNKLPIFRHPEQKLEEIFQSWNEELGQSLYEEEEERSSALKTFSSIFIQNSLPVERAFNVNLWRYNFKMFEANFLTQPQLMRNQINALINRKTRGLVSDLLLPREVTSQTELIGSSTAYFQAAWKHRFRLVSRGTGAFHLQDGSTVQVPIMIKTNNIKNHILCRPDQPKATSCGNQSIPDIIEIPFLNEDYKMIILSTNDVVTTLETIESKLATDLKTWKSAMGSNFLTLTMPQVELTHSIDLKQALAGQGLHSLANSSPSAFNALTKKSLLNTKFVHEASIKLREFGVTISAAEAPIGIPRINRGGLAQNHHAINRPFLFLFEHVPTGTIVLLGRITDPRNQNRS